MIYEKQLNGTVDDFEKQLNDTVDDFKKQLNDTIDDVEKVAKWFSRWNLKSYQMSGSRILKAKSFGPEWCWFWRIKDNSWLVTILVNQSVQL